VSTTKPNIFQRLAAVALHPDVAYVKKSVDSGSGGKGVARDQVVAQVRKHLFDAGVYVSTTQVGPGVTTQTGQKSSKGTELIRYTGLYATSFINTDDPEDRHVVMHEAHGNDYGDKAPGKASTYAEKLNIIKGLAMETGIADEARFPNEGDDEGKSPGKPSIGEEKLKNFEQSITAADNAKQLTETWQLAMKFIKANGDSPEDAKRVTEAASKRKGVIKTKAAEGIAAAKAAAKTKEVADDVGDAQ